MANPDNYFKPGQSGNPNGRPKREWTWAGLLEEAAEEHYVDDKGVDRGTFKALVTKRLLVQAANGDNYAVKILQDRMDGAPKQTVEGKFESPSLTAIAGAMIKIAEKK